MAKETQKAKIERLEKEIDMWREMCSKMEKELTEFRDMADNSFEKSSTYIQYSKRIEMLETQNEAYRLSVEHEKKMRSKLVDNYEPEIKRLNDCVQKLKSENKKLEKTLTDCVEYTERLSNRGAGRKKKFDDQEREAMRMYRIQGMTIREIADRFECSVGIVHKIINEK